MNIDIDRLKTDVDYWNSLAPEGAEYYCEDVGCFYKRCGSSMMLNNIEGEWVVSSFDNPRELQDYNGSLITKPTTVTTQQPSLHQAKDALVAYCKNNNLTVTTGMYLLEVLLKDETNGN